MKHKDPRKYKAHEGVITKARDLVSDARTAYVKGALDHWENGDCTPNQLKREFWEQLAEYWGFKIVWPQPEQPPQPTGDAREE